MEIALEEPRVDGMNEVLEALREWQVEGAPMQLHPGDIGWFWQTGAEATASAVRVWRRDGRIAAVGLLDGPDLVRLTIDPDARQDADLADRVAEDLAEPERGVLPRGSVYVEAPMDALLQDVMLGAGWKTDEPWTPLRRDLAEPVEDPGVRVEVVGPELVATRAAVQRAAFEGSKFSDERWHAMAAGPQYSDARCLVAFDDRDDAVAMVTVWSAGPGRPGLLEPMGVHRDHRGHGHGKAITVAAAAELRRMGASSAVVGTPSSNTGAVATYEAGGFRPLPATRDLSRVIGS
ncbi:GNAT family N-acetyltransferase [Salininema proteolyticum]|uniref:GNAT family N-acetyltransferase n=1 Tax=Salininema proteolyticum TaxID=1607685 RepID=A0ABV8U3P5_9ACTN